jgi:PQQ-like domain
MVTASPLFFDFSRYCPQPSCGEGVDALSRFCPYCGSSIVACPACPAANRLLARHCRACRTELAAEVWPLRAGLAASKVSFQTIRHLEAAHTPQRFGVEVMAQPVAADGLIIVPLATGAVALVSDTVGQMMGQIQVGETIAVAPALHCGFLYVASGKRVLAFDLARFLDQQLRLEPRPAWSVELAGQDVVQPLLSDDAAIYAMTRADGQMMLDALSTADGRRLWPQPARFAASHCLPPAMVSGRLLVITDAGLAYVISPADGHTYTSLNLGRQVARQVGPYVVGNRALIVDALNNVLEVVITDAGPLVNPLYNHRARVASLAASDDFIAIGHMAGVALLDARGHQLWSNNQMESVSVAPILAGHSLFVLDDAGNGLLFDVLNANPASRVRLFAGEVNTPPLLTHARVVALNAAGDLVMLKWS